MAKKPIPVQAKKPQQKPVSPTHRSEKKDSSWLRFALVALAITAACYFPSLSNGLVNWDDDPNITENPNLEMVGRGQTWGTTVSNIFDIDKGAVIGNYNPLSILTFAVEKSIAGGQFDEGYVKLIHTDNLLLHLQKKCFLCKHNYKIFHNNLSVVYKESFLLQKRQKNYKHGIIPAFLSSPIYIYIYIYIIVNLSSLPSR